MLDFVLHAMVYIGSALMVYNILGFVRYVRSIQDRKDWGRAPTILYIPVALLVMFLLGYLAVGLFGNPDLIVSGILLGGSFFVFIMFRFLLFITNHIQESEQMKVKLFAVEESERIKSEFLSIMCHELRTPMNAIIGLDTLVLQDENLDPQMRERMKKIDSSAKHMMNLVNDILDMNQITADKLTINEEAFSLREMLELLDLLIQTQCDERGLKYSHEALGDTDITCVGDMMRLRQALLNILDNAVKFTPAPGSVSFTTEITPEPDNRVALRFTIRDTGVGIDEAFMSRMFDSFAQENASATSQFCGSGLGLAIAKRIVDLMGGEITAESHKGQGSAFTVSLSLGRIEKQPEEAPQEPEEASLSGRRVLIVEDIDLNAEIVADLLEMEDMLSERAENGQVAVDMVSANPPGYYDAILMDLRMPVMDGLEATRRIRALPRPDAQTIPIIALTANAYEEDVRNSLEAGMNIHLAKPTDSEVLYETLRRLIKKSPPAEC